MTFKQSYESGDYEYILDADLDEAGDIFQILFTEKMKDIDGVEETEMSLLIEDVEYIHFMFGNLINVINNLKEKSKRNEGE